MTRSHRLIACLVAISFLAAASLFANDPADPFEEDHPAAKKPATPPKLIIRFDENDKTIAIEQALRSSTEFNFLNTPLSEVVNYLKERHHFEIQIDNKALSDAGIGTDTPVTVDLKGISLRSALNLMLRGLKLTWTIQDEVLMFTTPDEADQQLSTKVYDVADLVACRDEHDALSDDYDSLIDIITSTIKPTTWDEVGGAGSIQGNTLGTAKVLVVCQTYHVHSEIAELLAKIREIGKKTPNAGTPHRSKPTPPPQMG